jgi:hypothetical protein
MAIRILIRSEKGSYIVVEELEGAGEDFYFKGPLNKGAHAIETKRPPGSPCKDKNSRLHSLIVLTLITL